MRHMDFLSANGARSLPWQNTVHGSKQFYNSTILFYLFYFLFLPGRVAQSVTCLATDACLTADPGVVSSIPVRSHTFVEIDHEIISTVILLPSGDLFKKGCLSVTRESMCTVKQHDKQNLFYFFHNKEFTHL